MATQKGFDSNNLRRYGTAGLLGFICLVFVLEFGAGSRGCNVHSTQSTFAAEVYGATITEGDYRAAYLLAGGDRYPMQMQKQNKLKEKVLDALIERELLVRVAEKLGFEVKEADVMHKIADEGVIYRPELSEAPEILPGGESPVDFKDDSGNFDIESAKRFIRNYLKRTIDDFVGDQAHEMLASRVRDTVRASVAVSPSEVWDAYAREKDRATVDYLRFSPNFFRDTLTFTPAELQTWMAAHATDVNAEYDRQKHRYTNLEKQVRARHILIKVAGDATPEAKAAAKKKTEDLLARARGGEDFATLAREFSEDPGSAKKGGDLGYNPKGRMVPAFDTAQFALQPGQISDIVESDYGFHIIKVEGIREGDVPEAEAKTELAEKLYRDDQAKTLAEAAAKAAIEAIKGGETMEAFSERFAREHGAAHAAAEEGAEAPAAPADPYLPHLQTSRPFGRGDQPIPGASDSGTIARTAFTLTMAQPLAAEPQSYGDDFIVFALKELTLADHAAFTPEDNSRISSGLLREKEREALITYVRALRKEAQTAGKIRINEEVISYPTSADTEESASN